MKVYLATRYNTRYTIKYFDQKMGPIHILTTIVVLN